MMWRGLIGVMLIWLIPAVGVAQCTGQDLITALSEEQRTTLKTRVAQVPFGEGLLWRAVKGDSVITLFGTYHFRHRDSDTHLNRLKPLIEAADAVYLEVSNADQTQLQRDMATDPSLMFITQGPTLPDLLGEEDWDHYAQEMQARGFPGFMAAKLKPFWAMAMLGVGPCEARNGGLDSKGIDFLVGQYAGELGKESQSLENFRELLPVLDSDPLEDQIEMIRLSLAWPGNADDLSYTVREYYLAEKMALTLEFARQVSIEFGGENAERHMDRFEETFLKMRNKNWIEVLGERQESGALFIAVGAGHLPGEFGVLRLLENEGYRITRLPLVQ